MTSPKIITLWQPYASLCALNLKRNENRHWPTHYRGELYIHAAKRKMKAEDKAVWNDAIALAQAAGDARDFPAAEDLPLGAVLCTTQLIDCIEMTDSLLMAQSTAERLVGKWESGRYAWSLDKVHAFAEFIPWVGSQGLKPAPHELIARVECLRDFRKQGQIDAFRDGEPQGSHPDYLAGWLAARSQAQTFYAGSFK